MANDIWKRRDDAQGMVWQARCYLDDAIERRDKDAIRHWKARLASATEHYATVRAEYDAYVLALPKGPTEQDIANDFGYVTQLGERLW